jgi:hypothetical protein
MAVILSDVLRPESGETGLYYALRNRQSGFSTDTYKMIHKYQDGTIKKFPSEDVLSLYGATGVQGIKGETGLEGAAGMTGAQGYTGLQGATGLSGSGGTQGQTGIQGTTGVQGTQGVQGIQGNTGVQGIAGSQGIQGNTGVQGVAGSQGIQGQTGIQGIQGDTGIQGVTGVFAYNNIRMTDTGALQVYMRNNSGGNLSANTFVQYKTDNYTNGMTFSAVNMEKTVGILSESVSNGNSGWVTIKGTCGLLFDASYTVSAGDSFGISWGEDGPAYGMTLQSSSKAIGYAMTGVTGVNDYAVVYLNGTSIGQSQGVSDLNVIGYSSRYVTCSVVKDGSHVSIRVPSFSSAGANVDTTAGFGLELPGLIRPGNQTVSVPIPACYVFSNANSLVTHGHLHAEYDSSTYSFMFKLWKGDGTLAGWTGYCNWLNGFSLDYMMTPGI